MILNLFYEEKEDRWLPGDRHVRSLLRRLLIGKPQPAGHTRVFLNLCAGLDLLGIRYRVNDYRYIQRHPDELACVIGRRFLLNKIAWKNPILLGVAAYDHPVDAPGLFDRLPIKMVLVPGEWYVDMCRPYWERVRSWPVGIDTELWAPAPQEQKSVDVLLYDKVRWEHDRIAPALNDPIRARLSAEGRSVQELRYGSYAEEEFRQALARCRTMIFLCEHESQGIAYQQALSCDVPIFAWDRGGAWQDPNYFPHKVVYEPVSSVPYWDERCGMKFATIDEFQSQWPEFWRRSQSREFAPRSFILETLTLEQRAQQYYDIAKNVADGLAA
ncbi:MAG TPA: glycosyltransferase family 1 protein [Rhodopseudomonas sp.]|uniref:glycosyltransferase family 1 protein n=1 Tax=Rhodopseudomonas sp. TaxID=1078 RepID=UPI002ED8D659